MASVYVRTPRSNLPAVVEHRQYGFVRRSEAAAIHVGDIFVLYGRRPGTGRQSQYELWGVVRVVSESFEDRTPIYREGGLYPYRVTVKPVRLFEPGRGPELTKDLRNELNKAAIDVWSEFRRPSWANFQRFNKPLPAALGQKLLELAEKTDGIGEEDDLPAYLNALQGQVLSDPEPEPVPEVVAPPVVEKEEAAPPEASVGDEEVREHTRAQWMLGLIAARAQLDVWMARNDHKAVTPDGRSLVDISLAEFPDLPLPTDAQRPAKLIDVLWIDGERIPAAFEVEYSTNVTNGLLRLSDLAFSMGSSTVRLCIVAPERRLPKVRSEIERPSFRVAFDPKRERHCYFLSFEALNSLADAVLKLPEGVHIQAPRLEEVAVDLLKGASRR